MNFGRQVFYRDLSVQEARLDILQMISYMIAEMDDPDCIREVINGLHRFYEQKYLLMREDVKPEEKQEATE